MAQQVRWRFVFAAGIAALLGASASAQTARPRTIPALREWTAAPGVFEISGDSRILVRNAALQTDAEVFSEDLAALLSYPVPVVTNLIADVRMLAGMGAAAIPIFELSGTVDRWGADGVRAIVEAAREPMNEADRHPDAGVLPGDGRRGGLGDERRHRAAGGARRAQRLSRRLRRHASAARAGCKDRVGQRPAPAEVAREKAIS